MVRNIGRWAALFFIFLFCMPWFASCANAVDFQILFRPDGSGIFGCYEFTIAAVGGPLLLGVNELSNVGTRQNWGIDTVGGRGPWDDGVWKNRQSVLNRANQLSPDGADWYGCRNGRPLIGQPVFSMGWPNTPINYPVQTMWQILFRPNNLGPNCFEFYLAVVGENRVASPGILTPLARRENWGIDASGGLGSGPEGIWYDYGAASSRMNDLSSYGGDVYGCRGSARLMPPALSVGWPLPPDQDSNRALWQILRKPNRMGRNCFEFYLTNVGDNRVSAPGILTPLALREGWEIDFDGGAGSGPMGTWLERSAASSRMNKLSIYGGDWYGCRNVEPTPQDFRGILSGGLDPDARNALIANHRAVQVNFESSTATVKVNTDGSVELQAPIRCTITVIDSRRSRDITWSRHTYTVTLTPNGRAGRGTIKAFKQADYVWDYVERGKQGHRNHVGKATPVQGTLSQQGDVWQLSLPNGNGGSVGGIPYLLK